LIEKLLDTIASKAELASAALDADSDVDEVKMESGLEELRRRVERLIRKQPEGPVDVSLAARVETDVRTSEERRERVAAAGGQLVGAALELVGELLAERNRPEPDPQLVVQLRAGLNDSIERDPSGRPQLRLTLPDDDALARLATTLARLLIPQATS